VAQDKPAAEARPRRRPQPGSRRGSTGCGCCRGAAPAAAPAEAAAAPAAGPNTALAAGLHRLRHLMTLPGLALFYGGLVRSKNMLSVLMQCLMIFSVISILWAIYGYSFAFTEGNAFFGGTDRLFLKGLTVDAVAATFSKGVVVPELGYFAFQCAFAAITCA
jgi:Amt family ammonium transporter